MMKKCVICKKECTIVDKKFICNDCGVMIFDIAEDVMNYLTNCSNYILEHRDLIYRIEQNTLETKGCISAYQTELLDNLKTFQSLKADIKMRISRRNFCKKEIAKMLFEINEIMEQLPDLIDKCKE